jgi:hypothetical protein
MQPELERLVDAVYHEPNAFETAESFARAHHDDVPALTLDEVDAERILARLRWAVLIHRRQQPSPWLEDRIARLDQVAAQRRQRAQR